MPRRRYSPAPQRHGRASDAALQRRLEAPAVGQLGGPALVVIGVGALVVIGMVSILVFSLVTPGASETVGQPLANDGQTHIDTGTAGGPYSSTPAASGPHWPEPVNWGVYSDAIRQEPVIHNLEHGGIAIWYQASALTAEQVEALETYTRSANASERYKVLLAPWGGADFGHPIALVSWTWLLYLDEVDTGLMDRFVDQHYGDAPEPGGGPGRPPL